MGFFLSGFKNKREIHINTDYAIPGWMLCVISHIFKYVSENSNGNHRKQVKFFINTLFVIYKTINGILLQILYGAIIMLFYRDNNLFDGDEFIWKRNIYGMVIVTCGLRSIIYHASRYSFLAYRITPKISGIRSAECSQGDVKIIKFGKIYSVCCHNP